MKVDFLVLYSVRTPDVAQRVAGLLSQALVASYEEPPSRDELQERVLVRYEVPKADGTYIYGLQIDFDVADREASETVNTFARLLADSSDQGVAHVIKLLDPSLKARLQVYAAELYDLEMRLREALSVIFLDRATDDHYNLLSDVAVTPRSDLADSDRRLYLQRSFANEFFLLLFSDYTQINARRRPSSPRDMLELMARAVSFEEFRREFTSDPIERERYADFLASLKAYLDPIEKVRNCVAHNREIPSRLEANYELARDSLLSAIDGFLGDLSTREDS